MHKNLLHLSIAILSLVINANAQVIFNSTDYAAQNDTFRISKADSLWTTDFDTTGVGITWDYSLLTPYTQTVEEVIAPNSSGYIFTPVSFQNSLDRAEPISDTLYIGSIELTNTYNFFDLTSTQYKHVARASEIEGVEMKTKYDSSDVLYTFPMQYGNSKDSSNSGYTISIASILYYTHTQKRVNEIEGEGTLITPYGTFSTLKLTSTTVSTDSFSIDTFGIPQYSYTTVEYKWFNPNYGYPLLEVTKEIVSGITISISAGYLDSIRYFIPAALFAYYPETPVQGDAITFQNLSSNATSYSWDFGDGNTSTSVNPSYTYTDTGTYVVSLIASNPTSADTFSLPVFVTDSNAIISYFAYSPQYPCYGTDTITFFNTSYNATSYLWDFGDGHASTAVDTSYVYASPGIYNVMLIAYKTGSSDTMITEIIVPEIPVASFSVSDSISPVIFTNTSTGTDTGTTFYWSFGFGADPSSSTEENPIVEYGFTGDKTVYLTTYNSAGCYSTYVTSINVSEIDSDEVISYFSYTPQDPCLGDTISFLNNSYNANTYLWSFGDGQNSTDQNPTHVYSSAGYYTVKLIAYKSGNSDTSIAEVEYAAMPLASFEAEDTLVGSPLTFVNTSSDVDSSANFYWDFGVDANPIASTAENPTVTYGSEGEKVVNLIVYNSPGCYSIYTDTILIYNIVSEIFFAENNLSDQLLIYGNDNIITIEYKLNKNLANEFRISNILGESVYSQQLNKQEGKLEIAFQLKGVFIIQLSDLSGNLISKKFIKVN
jgi:PKD repeat protein